MDRKLLADTKKVMEEVLETEQIFGDIDLLQTIRLSKDDVKSGRTAPWDELKCELRSKGKL